MNLIVRPGNGLQGSCQVPGDKSISHRAALLGAIAEGKTVINNFQFGADCRSTLRCIEALGVDVCVQGSRVEVTGNGLHGLQEPEVVLDAGNSGTTTRLLLGILAGQDFFTTLTGDESLCQRPMGRVVTPLREMGAAIWGRAGGGKAPLAIRGRAVLQGITWQLPVASAQVKSAILLAGLYTNGLTGVIQPALSRDHTERMLRTFGARVEVDGLTARVFGGSVLQAQQVTVPGDISSAAFLLVAATIIPGSELVIGGVGINPTRTGIIEVLREMGANIEVLNQRVWSGEPVADLRVRSSKLHGITIGDEIIPRLVDEIPVLAVAAAAATGVTEISDAAELRVKETDRLQVITGSLRQLGVAIEEKPDGLRIFGGCQLSGATVSSRGDHRIAMSLAVAGLVCVGETVITGFDCATVSFPGFATTLSQLGATLEN